MWRHGTLGRSLGTRWTWTSPGCNPRGELRRRIVHLSKEAVRESDGKVDEEERVIQEKKKREI